MRRHRSAESGAVAVEFALVLPLLLLLALGIYDFGRLQYERIVVTSAAYEAARASALWKTGDTWNGVAITSGAQAATLVGQAAAGNVTITLTAGPTSPGCASAGTNTVTLTATHNGQTRFPFVTPGLTGLNVSVTVSGAFRCLSQ
jgi:Flp pilus assembly protein TadG